ncbi:hypothetical protein PWT90_06896 [Aphanocladium album]|nr:hypothetical protein PWT90_06896 [Aphanocladium album]
MRPWGGMVEPARRGRWDSRGQFWGRAFDWGRRAACVTGEEVTWSYRHWWVAEQVPLGQVLLTNETGGRAPPVAMSSVCWVPVAAGSSCSVPPPVPVCLAIASCERLSTLPTGKYQFIIITCQDSAVIIIINIVAIFHGFLTIIGKNSVPDSSTIPLSPPADTTLLPAASTCPPTE